MHISWTSHGKAACQRFDPKFKDSVQKREKVAVISFSFGYSLVSATDENSCSFSFELNINAVREDPCEGLSPGPHAWLSCLQMAVIAKTSLDGGAIFVHGLLRL